MTVRLITFWKERTEKSKEYKKSESKNGNVPTFLCRIMLFFEVKKSRKVVMKEENLEK